MMFSFIIGNRPSYAQIAEWRKILNRLSYFLRMVDYLLMEVLHRLTVTATRLLRDSIQASASAGGMEEDEEVGNIVTQHLIFL